MAFGDWISIIITSQKTTHAIFVKSSIYIHNVSHLPQGKRVRGARRAGWGSRRRRQPRDCRRWRQLPKFRRLQHELWIVRRTAKQTCLHVCVSVVRAWAMAISVKMNLRSSRTQIWRTEQLRTWSVGHSLVLTNWSNFPREWCLVLQICALDDLMCGFNTSLFIFTLWVWTQ